MYRARAAAASPKLTNADCTALKRISKKMCESKKSPTRSSSKKSTKKSTEKECGPDRFLNKKTGRCKKYPGSSKKSTTRGRPKGSKNKKKK